MPDYKVVALWVVERGEAPGVFEGDEVGLLRMVVEMNGPEASDLFSRHLRAVNSFLERRRKYCHMISPCCVASFADSLRVVHIKKNPLYLLCSNSAIMQSTMWALGVMMYMASMSL
jgi:hypothetical protein